LVKTRSVVSSSVLVAGLLAAACGQTGGTGAGAEREAVGTVSQAVTYAPQAVSNNTSKRVFMHLMPWFQAKSTEHGFAGQNNQFGIHWTMANCGDQNNNGYLDNATTNGGDRVCAVDRPLIGPYSSNDPYVVEYHLLLMKYAGMDGFVVDWGGVMNIEDLPQNKVNGEAYIARAADFGLNFWTIMEDRNYQRDNCGTQWDCAHNDTDDIADGVADMNCLKAGGSCGNTYFGHSKYEKHNNKPLVGIFGPIWLQNGGLWDSVYSGAGLNNDSTVHLSLWWEKGDLGSKGDGTMAWMWSGQGSVGDGSWSHITHAQHYANVEPAPSGDGVKMPSVFPGHDPYYGRGGWGSDAGNFFVGWNASNINQTMDIALASNANYLQLATWNDFGEGTHFEPSVGHGYSALEAVQQKLGVAYNKTHLELIKKLFDERVAARKANNTSRLTALDDASAALAALNVQAATNIINGTSTGTCTDSVKNNAETDVDCGGSSCPKCSNGKLCSAASDCSSNVCSSGTCVATASQTAYGSGQSIPGTIEAENYDNGGQDIAFYDTSASNEGGQYRTATGDSVDVQNTSDGGAGQRNVGWTNTGEWLEYTFTNSTTRNYDFKLRTASDPGGGRITLAIDGTLISSVVDVPDTNGWQTWTDVSVVNNKQVVSGTHVLRVNVVNGGFNLNNIVVTASATGPVCGNGSCESGESCSSCSGDCGSCSTQAPFGGVMAKIPGILEMDKFDTGGENVAYHDDSTKSGGGLRPETNVDLENHNGTGVNIGWTVAGEWLEWTVDVLETGTYDIRAQTAGNGGTFRVLVDGSDVSGTMTAVNTGQWQVYSPVTKTGVSLTAGTRLVRLELLNDVAYNLKSLEFVKTGTGGGGPGPTPITQWPYGSTQQYPAPQQLPGTIQAENFDEGGPDIAYKDTSTNNEGSSNHRSGTQVDLCFHGNNESKICYGQSLEWTEYTVNVKSTATYDITTRYTNGCSSNATWKLEVDGTSLGTFTGTYSANDWGTFRTATLDNVSLQAGQHVLRYFNNTGCHDVDWFSFVVDSGQPPPPPPQGPTLTKTLKNVATGMYAYRDGALVKYTANPDPYGKSAQWTIEDYSGYKRIRNDGNLCLVHIENYASNGSMAQCDTNTSDGWMSNRWNQTTISTNTYVFSNAWQNTELNCYGSPPNGVQCTERGTNTDAQWLYNP
jgi:hypothetical protein